MNDIAGKPISDTRAWRGAELSRGDWVTRLSSDQIGALYETANTLSDDSSKWLDFDSAQITDETLSNLFAVAGNELLTGRGFVLFRGLDAHDTERLRRVFWILGKGLGKPVMQNAKGEVLSIVADRFAGAERGVDTRGYESNDELRFHCDGGDCIGMSCIRQAREGGTNGLVSLYALYNEILHQHPQHLDALQQGFPLYSRKEQGDAASTEKLGKVQPTRIPVFAWQDGAMSTWLNIQLAELAAQMSGQAYNDAEREALECIERLANDPDLQLTFKQQPGDVIFINNLAVMHRREKYHDTSDPTQNRALYRMWINLHQQRSVVPQHAALRKGIRGPQPLIAAAV